MIGQIKHIERKYDTLFGDIYTKDNRIYKVMAEKHGHHTKLYNTLKNGEYIRFNSYSNMEATEIKYIPEEDNNDIRYNRVNEFNTLVDTTKAEEVVLKDFGIVVESYYERKNYNETESYCYDKAREKLEGKVKKLGGNSTINFTKKLERIWRGKDLIDIYKVKGTVAIIGKPDFSGEFSKEELIAYHLKDVKTVNSVIDKIKEFFKRN